MTESTIKVEDLTFDHLGETVEVTFLRNPGEESITLLGPLSKISAFKSTSPPRYSNAKRKFEFGSREKELKIVLKVGSSETKSLDADHPIRLSQEG